MRFTTIISGLVLAASTSARIIGIAVPTEIEAETDFNVTIITDIYIQSVADISAVFGVWNRVYPSTLGVSAGSVYLGPSKSTNILFR